MPAIRVAKDPADPPPARYLVRRGGDGTADPAAAGVRL